MNVDEINDPIELEKRVYLIDENTIFYDEFKDTNPEKISMLWNRVGDLIQPNKKYCMLVDLVDAEPPSAAVREQLRIEHKKYKASIKLFSVYTGKNKLINLSIQFVMAGGALEKISINKTKEEALAEIKKYIDK